MKIKININMNMNMNTAHSRLIEQVAFLRCGVEGSFELVSDVITRIELAQSFAVFVFGTVLLVLFGCG